MGGDVCLMVGLDSAINFQKVDNTEQYNIWYDIRRNNGKSWLIATLFKIIQKWSIHFEL